MEPNSKIAFSEKWKRLYDRMDLRCIYVSANMETNGWMASLDARVRGRVWQRFSRETLLYHMQYIVDRRLRDMDLPNTMFYFPPPIGLGRTS